MDESFDNGAKEREDKENQKQQKVMPRDCNAIENAVDPVTGQRCTLYVRNRTVKLTAAKGMGAARELAYTVLHAVQKPTAVFRGVTDEDGEDGDTDWLVYVTVPPRVYDHKTGETRESWEGEVFLVFVDGDGIIQRWSWTEADGRSSNLPFGFDQGRFLEQLL